VRVLVTSTAGYGHVLPMFPLAQALLRRGHEVLWVVPADISGRVRAAGFAVTEAGLTDAEAVPLRAAARQSVAGLPPEVAPLYLFARIFGRERAAPMLAGLLPVAEAWRPDLVLHEQGELAAPLVASLLGVPHADHAFGGAIPASALADGGAAVADLWSEHGLAVPPYAGCFEHLYLDICPPSLQTVPLDHIPVVQAARPVTYDGEAPTEIEPILGTDDDRPLVYLTLGTVSNQVALLRAITAAVAALDVRLLVTVGPGIDPADLGTQRAGVTVRQWVPQAAVLPHCAAVVSHGGSGTLLAAAALGLSQVCLPQGADQFRNTDGLTRATAGIALHPDVATPEAIAAAVRAVLTDPALQDGAGRVRDEIAAMPSPDDVADRLERLIEESPRPAVR
jgi:UDP:flavonoid glycosyltransferase YjiC (YdhE family)